MKRFKKLTALALTGVMALSLTACVDQHPDEGPENSGDSTETRIVGTSNATIQILDRLGLDLIAIPTTTGSIPERYQGLPEIGTAMAPDAEQIALLEPTDVIGPDTLIESIQPTYEAAGIPSTFIDLQSVEGMYDSIAMLGEKYGKQAEADAMIGEYEAKMAEFQASVEGKEAPRFWCSWACPALTSSAPPTPMWVLWWSWPVQRAWCRWMTT